MGNPSMLTSNEVKAANRAEATALLVPAGYRVHRPKADCYGEDLYGEDLVVPDARAETCYLLPLQLRSRPPARWTKRE